MVGSPVKLCICQICNCGRHRCPHNPKKTAVTGPCEISEYTNKYVAYSVKPVESCKPPHRGVQAEGKMASDTTHRNDFIPHPLSMQASCKKDAIYEPPTQLFDGMSTYNKEYTTKPICKTDPIKPSSKRNLSAKFVGEPTYRADYRQWEIEQRKPHVAAAYTAPTEPFGGLATYTTDYTPHYVPPPQSCKPIHLYSGPDVPFGGISDYRDAYRKPNVTERTRPIVNKECTQRSGVPMEGVSTHMRDYDWKTGGPSASCKPIYKGIHSESPFQSDTTHRADFKQWPQGLSRVESIHHTGAYEPPKGCMDTDTTYMRDYHPHNESIKAQPAGPKYNRLTSLPPFEGTTDYRDSYRAWGVGPRVHGVGPGSSYYRSIMPFDGQSTSKQHYLPHWGCKPALSCKPHPRASDNQGEFDDATMYRLEYTPKSIEPCPTLLLNTERSSYTYAQQNEQGHLLYYKKTETETNLQPVTDNEQNNLGGNTLRAAPVAVVN
ncbi:hypothetical protein EG68_00670 [Paragonimus skrjabini miyazakii]|uniref:Stabilizer of axonemal microtubules 2 n=1 Tax=Paragonimus skrjabini miyazakii TaxID=59628 RepID=A0A8S9Z3W7_9TREM|nr:hypothetical protein EG68_00670 [Paragonimus skrjabini miyazakii]